jgi:serine/threonine-protein kinase HipA
VTTVAEVRLWGRTIGAVSLGYDEAGDDESVASFEYDAPFLKSGIEVSPIVMPLSDRVYSFPELPRLTFSGLPGLLADSLPDRFGNALIDAWLASQGRTANSFNAVERLCYIGARGMGALEFAPAIGPRARKTSQIQIDQLVSLASDVLTHRQELQASFGDADRAKALTDILRVGTSAGGARAKAVIAWNPGSNEVRSGQVPADEGFEYWLLKFDGVSGNKDKELDDPEGYGAVEFAYSMMARDCGIAMNECRLFEEGGRRHFMTRRFDRLDGGKKLHMQSLGSLAHFDFNSAGAHSYEQALFVTRQLGLPLSAIEELFRRMVFNIVGRNQDDHVKNIAYLMDKAGNWSLAPAFDMTYSFNPDGAWTNSHQMTLNGKRDKFTQDDFDACAKGALMKRGRAATIIGEVVETVSSWKKYAARADVDMHRQNQIQRSLRLTF